MKTFYESKTGMNLETFLTKNKSNLINKRVFYVVQPNLDEPTVVKIGISTSAVNRKKGVEK